MNRILWKITLAAKDFFHSKFEAKTQVKKLVDLYLNLLVNTQEGPFFQLAFLTINPKQTSELHSVQCGCLVFFLGGWLIDVLAGMLQKYHSSLEKTLPYQLCVFAPAKFKGHG